MEASRPKNCQHRPNEALSFENKVDELIAAQVDLLRPLNVHMGSYSCEGKRGIDLRYLVEAGRGYKRPLLHPLDQVHRLSLL